MEKKGVVLNSVLVHNSIIVIKKSELKMNVSAVSFDAKSGNYMAKVGSKTIKSYSKAYVERRVKAMVGDVETAVAVATEKQNRYDINTRFGFVEKLVNMVATLSLIHI